MADEPTNDAQVELRLRAIAPPLVLILAFLAMRSATLSGLARIVCGMPLHELGHAIAGWLSGFAAIPGLWRTAIPDERSTLFTILWLGALAAGGGFAWRAGQRRVAYGVAAVAALTLILTAGLRVPRAQAFILFAGDGGAMVLGALLVAAFFAGPDSAVHRGWLRWGFLVIGAAGFADPFSMWWRARRDLDVIPFGEIDGVGDSDPSRLVDEHGWSVHALVARYVTLGLVLLAGLVIVYAIGILRSPREDAFGPPRE